LLYGLARELVTNVARHASASSLQVDIARVADEIHLSVRDDGVGCTPDRRRQALREGHLGLASWTERVRALGGDLYMEPASGEGTQVLARIPVPD
jgi:two-component system NarL family sensor kinase